MRYLLYFVFCLFSIPILSAQDGEYRNQILVGHDNDFFTRSDRYYSFGTWFNYSRALESDFIFRKEDDGVLQLNFSLFQAGYSPDELDERNTDVFDYPFSGWLSVSSEILKANRKNLWGLQLEAGVTGNASLAGKLQIWYHDLLDFGDEPTWEAQIPGEFMLNLKGRYIADFRLSEKGGAFFSLESNASLGTKDIFVQQGLTFSFGRRRTLHQSSLYNIIGNDQTEFFGYVGASYRYVAHNSLIEGSFLNDNAPFTLDAETHLLFFKAGVTLNIKRSIFKVEYRANSKETPLARNHSFISLAFGRNF
ncbi:DUF2219 family protein [Leptobacterium flavescens]|uniref:DUF2219 family protein n=1 Tax=Leptobacterium flavescens TaxID=472055 RepID=A0A6P0UQM9_9FLAO|nr:lipid A-modifier LpxR family protein [Leptobacterium flavescens]NER14822.1 DUF2219 family protein [Leptobacterium flavescens]